MGCIPNIMRFSLNHILSTPGWQYAFDLNFKATIDARKVVPKRQPEKGQVVAWASTILFSGVRVPRSSRLQ